MGSDVIGPTGNVVQATDATASENVKALELAGSKMAVDRLNADLKARYLSLFSDYSKNMDTGRISTNPDSPVYQAPPKPPMAFELAPEDENGYVWYQIGKTPVCDMPPLPEDHSLTQGQINAAKPANTIDIGQHLQGNWYSLGKHDTFTVGETTPPIQDPDGTFHQYEKFGGFAPGTGWYLRIN
jgi:hypothetical protein